MTDNLPPLPRHPEHGWVWTEAEQRAIRAYAAQAVAAALEENEALRERMADLLTRTAVALRGPEPPLTRWSWHDLPERAAAAIAALDAMQRAAFLAVCGEPPMHPSPDTEARATFARGDLVRKRSGSAWEGIVVGEYSTSLTPEGYAVESLYHPGSVQIYPAAALELVARSTTPNAKLTGTQREDNHD